MSQRNGTVQYCAVQPKLLLLSRRQMKKMAKDKAAVPGRGRGRGAWAIIPCMACRHGIIGDA